MSRTIRSMTLDDYPQVRDLWLRSPGVGLDESDRPEGIALYLRRNPELSVVAVEENRIVGAVLCGHDGRRGYLSHLAVASEVRGRGIGRALVTACLERLAAAGIVKCNLRIYTDNEHGRRFWERLGWTPRDDVHVMTIHTPAATDRSDPRGSARPRA